MKYILKLYIYGETSNSKRALKNLNKIVAEYLNNQSMIEIIDIGKNPQIAIDERIVAVPTLIKNYPPPYRKVIGDLSDTESVILSFRLRTLKKNSTKSCIIYNGE